MQTKALVKKSIGGRRRGEGERRRGGKKKISHFGDVDVRVKEQAREPGGFAALPGVGMRVPAPPRGGGGRLLPEAVHFPPGAGGYGTGRPREGLPGRQGRFCGWQKEVSGSGRAARCSCVVSPPPSPPSSPAPRGDAWLQGTRRDPFQARQNRGHREEGASPLGAARDQRGGGKENRGKRSFWVDG